MEHKNLEVTSLLEIQHPLHEAVSKGNVKLLKTLLGKDPALFQGDSNGRTPLHCACAFEYQRKAVIMVEMLLDHLKSFLSNVVVKEILNRQDVDGETALHIAARNSHEKIIKILIFAAADSQLKDKNGIDPLQTIYNKVPCAILPFYNSSVKCKVGDPEDHNLIVTIDFGSIVGFSTLDSKKKTIYEPETKLLTHCLTLTPERQAVVLLHPLVQTFLYLKWKKIRFLLWISLLYHAVWLLLYITFITDLYKFRCPFNSTFNAELGTFPLTACQIGRDSHPIIYTELGSLFFITATVAIKETYGMYSSPQLSLYFSQLANYGQLTLIWMVGLTSIPILLKDEEFVVRIDSWQYQAAAFGVFLAWIMVLLLIGKFPKTAVYIEILKKVLKSFAMFMLTFASLMVAFTMSFQILIPGKLEFSHFPWGIIKTLVMMNGEFNYDEVFYGDHVENNIPFPILTKLLFAAFIAVVTVVLYNLLIGLTVSDIRTLETMAQLNSLSSQLEQIYLLERFNLSKVLQRLIIYIGAKYWLRHLFLTRRWGKAGSAGTGMTIDLHISEIHHSLQHGIRGIAISNMSQDDDDDEVSEGELLSSVSSVSSESSGLLRQVRITAL